MEREIIDFWGDGCGNCAVLAPIIDKIALEHADIKITKLNVKDSEDQAAKYGVSSLPTLVFLRDGAEVAKMTGLKPKTLIEKKIAEVF